MDKIKILVVDDEARMRKLVKDFLSIKGYQVLEAGDGEEAVDLFFQQKDIALILLDVMMPKMDGWEVVKTIRKYSQVPIIMLTARGEESDELIEWLFSHEEFRSMAGAAGMSVRPGSSFRHLAVQENADLTGIVLAPPHDHLNEKIGPILPAGNNNAKTLLALMEKANELLEHHPINEKRRAEGRLPANGIWFWAEGKGARLPNFTQHYGADGGVISAVPLCHGIAVLVGLEPISVPTATGEWDTDYEAKTRAALDVLRSHDFAAVHLEGPDEATHNHDLEHTIYSVVCLSERVLKPLCEELRARGEDFRVLILSDHRTFMRNGAHGATPVPFMIYDSREPAPGSGLSYSEANGEQGPFLTSGTYLMPMLFSK